MRVQYRPRLLSCRNSTGLYGVEPEVPGSHSGDGIYIHNLLDIADKTLPLNTASGESRLDTQPFDLVVVDMWVLTILSYLGALLAFVFLTLSIGKEILMKY